MSHWKTLMCRWLDAVHRWSGNAESNGPDDSEVLELPDVAALSEPPRPPSNDRVPSLRLVSEST